MGAMSDKPVSQALVTLSILGLLVSALLFGVDGASEESEPTETPATTKPTRKAEWRGGQYPRALVVKVDNAAAARPHTGLGAADAIVVEPVEGGITRLLAVYWGKRPASVGPVRSARESDIRLLGQIRRPVLAYSGASRYLIPTLEKAPMVLANPRNTSGAFSRRAGKAPHNQYVNPARLPATKAVASPLTSSAKPPPGGVAKSSETVSYRSATYDFRWSAGQRKWTIAVDGKPMTTRDTGALTADTVVVQRVSIVRGLGIKDSAGSPSPVADTTGTGAATVLRDGRSYAAKWRRPATSKPTQYRTTAGKRMPLKGTVWIVLAPA